MVLELRPAHDPNKEYGFVGVVTSLLYLVPPCTALMAWALFGEAFTATMLVGMMLTVGGVALVFQ